jgi:DNA-binding NarL/FixJ family response regulator
MLGRAMIRVLVVEDEQTLAGALQIAFGAQPDMDCVGAVGTAEEAVVLAAASSPDVVLMDIRLPGIDGVEATRQVKAACPQVRVLILTAEATPARLAAAAAAGASGFLAKDSPFPAILAAIRAPVDGTILVEQNTMAALIESQDRVSAPVDSRMPGQARLTARERPWRSLMTCTIAAWARCCRST